MFLCVASVVLGIEFYGTKRNGIMKLSEFKAVRLACAYFFICPGLTYGIFTSRIPALKEQTGAEEAQIGLILLCLGGSSLLTLLSSAWFVKRFGSKNVLRYASLVCLTAITLFGLAPNPWVLGFFCLFAGFGTGLVDVAMNTQGVQIEKKYTVSCMAFMHASYSFGGVVGSVSGAVFAGLGLSPFVNAAAVLGFYALFRFWAVPHLLQETEAVSQTDGQKQAAVSGSFIPFFVLFCGVMAMVAYACEGSVAEWGSLFMHTVKHASEQTAALVFACFSATTVFCRLFGDRMREYCGDFVLCFGGAVISAAGLSLALFADSAYLALAGFALMGAGLSPIVPILFSRAGQYPGINPGKACAVVSVLSYSGLLFHPPLLGFLAHSKGLKNALLVVLGMCCFLIAASLFFAKKK